MKVWITKYALTEGIYEAEAELPLIEGDRMIRTKDSNGWSIYYHKSDWHKTREAAVERAEWMLQKKIASLEKQLVKYKDMTIE